MQNNSWSETHELVFFNLHNRNIDHAFISSVAKHGFWRIFCAASDCKTASRAYLGLLNKGQGPIKYKSAAVMPQKSAFMGSTLT